MGEFSAGDYEFPESDIGKAKIEAIKRKWARAAVDEIIEAQGTGAEKADLYEDLAQEIQSRVTAIKQGPYPSAIPWSARRISVGEGAFIFVGKSGYVIEIQADGTVHKRKLVLSPGEDVYSPDWNPPYIGGIPRPGKYIDEPIEAPLRRRAG